MAKGRLAISPRFRLRGLYEAGYASVLTVSHAYF